MIPLPLIWLRRVSSSPMQIGHTLQMSKEISTNRFAWKGTNNNFCPGWHNCSRTSLTSLRSIITHNNEVQMPMCYPGHNRLSIQTKGLCLGKVTCLPFNPCPRLSFLFPGESPARRCKLVTPFRCQKNIDKSIYMEGN